MYVALGVLGWRYWTGLSDETSLVKLALIIFMLVRVCWTE